MKLSSGGVLNLWLNDNPDSTTDHLELYVGAETFALNEADAEGQRDWSWNDSGLSWSGGEAVDLRIVQNRVPEFDEGSSQSRLLSENLGDAVTETALDLETRTETPCCKEGFGE